MGRESRKGPCVRTARHRRSRMEDTDSDASACSRRSFALDAKACPSPGLHVPARTRDDAVPQAAAISISGEAPTSESTQKRHVEGYRSLRRSSRKRSSKPCGQRIVMSRAMTALSAAPSRRRAAIERTESRHWVRDIDPCPNVRDSGTRGAGLASATAASTAASGFGASPMPAVIAQRAPASSMRVRAGTNATERAGERNAKDAKRTGEGPGTGDEAGAASHARRTRAMASGVADSSVSARPRPIMERRSPSQAAPPDAGSRDVSEQVDPGCCGGRTNARKARREQPQSSCMGPW